MVPLIFLLLLFPTTVFAQLQLHLSAEASLNYLPYSPAVKVSESSRSLVLSFAAGAELWFPGKNDNYPFALYAQQGWATTPQLQAEFSGTAVGATPENGRMIFARAKLLRFNYRQIGGLAKVLRFSGEDFETALLVGAGLRFIHGERVHIGASEFGRGSDRLQVVTDGYEIDKQGIRPNADLASGVFLKENMLRKVIPFTEAGLDVKNEKGVSYFLMLQFSLQPVVDPVFYQDRVNGQSWIQLRVGARGRLL